MNYKLIAVLCFLSICFTACGEEKKGPAKEAAKPVTGGTLSYGKNGPPITLDPAKSRESESSIIIGNLFDPLVEQTAGKVDIEPGLAKSWEISADGMVYTFHLRDGVKFHDGTPFNADAVLFSIERQKNTSHPYHEAGQFYNWTNFNMDKIMKSVEKIDDGTIRITLTEASAPFLFILSMDFMDIVSPAAVKKYGSDFSKQPVGTGPFEFASWESDNTVKTRANEAYWNGRPYLDELIFLPIGDGAERWKKLQDGSIDLMDSPRNTDLAEIKKNSAIKTVSQAGVNISYMAMNIRKKPFGDVRVRRAINLAINKNFLVSSVFGSSGRAAKNPIPPVLLGYNAAIRPIAFNQDSARQLLKEAGYPNGFKTTLWAMPISREYMPDGKKTAELISQNLNAVGIDATIVSYPWSEYLERTYAGEHDMAILGWVADVPDPDNFFSPLLSREAAASKSSSNVAFYESQVMQDLITKGKRTPDPKTRRDIYQEACTMFNLDLPWVPLAHSEVIVPMRQNVMNFKLYASSKRRFNKVWLAKSE